MFLYLFSHIETLTSRYHSDGGLVIVADDFEQAIELAIGEGVQFTQDELETVKTFRLAEASQPATYIFPDAGCC